MTNPHPDRHAGSGKTTVGEALSRLHRPGGRGSGQMIETTAGCSIPEIFQREGESGFRAGSGPPRRRLGSAQASSSSPAAVSSRRRKTTRPSIRTAASISWCGISACCPPRAGPCPRGRIWPPCGGSGAPGTPDSGTWRLTTAARWRTPPPPSGGIFVHILVVNGPNMNMLGIRQPEIYGHETYEDLKALIRGGGGPAGRVRLLLPVQATRGPWWDAIPACILRPCGRHHHHPAAYTHTSVALLDAVKAVGPHGGGPRLRPGQREEFRRVSYIRAACAPAIRGHGSGICGGLRFSAARTA